MSAISELPEDGELQIGQISLPAGRRIAADYGNGELIAWTTFEPVPDPGLAWLALSQASPASGLVPFLLANLDDPISNGGAKAAARTGLGAARPWDTGEFSSPTDVTGLDQLSAADLISELWEDVEEYDDEEAEEEDDEFAQMRAPFTAQFPGLAPAEQDQLSEDRLARVLGDLPPTRMGLAVASRPADVLPLIGWDGVVNRYDDALPIAAVLRSWERRFGASLLQIGFAEIRLLVTRPPRTLRSAQLLAAEHFAFADECAGTGLHDVQGITEHLLESPFWTFWWD